jgi:hypothetical protein
MVKSCLAAFSATFLASVTVLTSGDAEAVGYIRRQASECFVFDVTNTGSYPNGPISAYYGVYNAGNIGDTFEVDCPIPEDDRFTLSGITYTNVHVYDGSASRNVCAARCWTYWSSGGGSCGASVCTTGFQVERTLSPVGAIPSGVFMYLSVSLPEACAVRGYSAG